MSAGPIFREQADLAELLNPDLTPTAFRRFVEVPPFPVLPKAVAGHIGWWRGSYPTY